MNEAEMIRKTEAFLRQKFDESEYMNAHPAEKSYRLEHSYRVANIGRQIARAEGIDETEITIACLLHDIAYCSGSWEGGWKEHGRISARIARPFLEGLDLSPEQINEICYGIAIHVDDEADFAGDRTPLAVTVGDADNIDRFDVLRIHEWLNRDGFMDLSLEDKKEYANKRLDGLKKLADVHMETAAAEEMWRERIAFYAVFYEKLVSQLRCSEGLTD